MTSINNPYYIKSKRLAMSIHFVSSLPYMIFDDKDNPQIKKYAFENTEKFQQVLTDINKLRKKYQ